MKQIKIFCATDSVSQLEKDINEFLKDNSDSISCVRINYQVVKPASYCYYSALVEYLLHD